MTQHPTVQRWAAQLSGWRRLVYRILSAIGQDEAAYKMLGFYQWAGIDSPK